SLLEAGALPGLRLDCLLLCRLTRYLNKDADLAKAEDVAQPNGAARRGCPALVAAAISKPLPRSKGQALRRQGVVYGLDERIGDCAVRRHGHREDGRPRGGRVKV